MIRVHSIEGLSGQPISYYAWDGAQVQSTDSFAIYTQLGPRSRNWSRRKPLACLLGGNRTTTIICSNQGLSGNDWALA
ncbi:hypothetical protein EYC84_003151 [Monilinia fructicola]|uniref:Uncharacterized protein n=1 Tax=Monilinia fructicola TaxID=38448 RepID=A0A5M9JSR6_MONFR|nr:hypothetical protein EYC84_003151 [Monilinia fructicola]